MTPTPILTVLVAGLLAGPADLVPLLAVEDYHGRVNASRRLAFHLTHVPDPALTAVRGGLGHPDPEVRQACDRLLRWNRPARAARATKAIDAAFTVFPFVDGLWYDHANRRYDHARTEYWAYRDYMSSPASFDPWLAPWARWEARPDTRFGLYQAATRLVAIVWVTEGMPVDAVRVRFLVLHYRDAVYLYAAGQVKPGPLPWLGHLVYAFDQVFPGGR